MPIAWLDWLRISSARLKASIQKFFNFLLCLGLARKPPFSEYPLQPIPLCCEVVLRYYLGLSPPIQKWSLVLPTTSVSRSNIYSAVQEYLFMALIPGGPAGLGALVTTGASILPTFTEGINQLVAVTPGRISSLRRLYDSGAINNFVENYVPVDMANAFRNIYQTMRGHEEMYPTIHLGGLYRNGTRVPGWDNVTQKINGGLNASVPLLMPPGVMNFTSSPAAPLYDPGSRDRTYYRGGAIPVYRSYGYRVGPARGSRRRGYTRGKARIRRAPFHSRNTRGVRFLSNGFGRGYGPGGRGRSRIRRFTRKLRYY